MEIDEACQDLLALRLLYGLLQEGSVGLQSASSKDLVERARVLLKDMLDVALERFSQIHSKMLSTEGDATDTSCTFQPGGAVVGLWPKPPIPPTSTTQSFVKDLKHCGVNLNISEQPRLKLQSQEPVPDPSTSGILEKGGVEDIEKCRICGKPRVVKGTNKPNEKGALPNIDGILHDQQYNQGSPFHGIVGNMQKPSQTCEAKFDDLMETIHMKKWSRVAEISCNLSTTSKEGDFLGEVINSIRRIECGILALQLKKKEGMVTRIYPRVGWPVLQGNGLPISQTSQLTRNPRSPVSANRPPNLAFVGNESVLQNSRQKERLQTSKWPAKSVDMSSELSSLKGIDTRYTKPAMEQRLLHQSPRGNVKAMSKVVEQSNQWNVIDQARECVQGFRVSLNQENLSKRPSLQQAGNTKDNPLKNLSAQEDIRKRTDSTPKSSNHLLKSLPSTVTISNKRDKKPSHRMVIRPTLLDHKSSDIKISPSVYKDWKVRERRGTIKRRHLDTRYEVSSELEESCSPSPSFSSSWTTQESMTSYYEGPSSDTDSEDCSLPSQKRTSRVKVATSRRTAHEVYGSSSDESDPEEEMSASFRKEYARPTFNKRYKSTHQIDPKKHIGRLRRLKNKLGLIFHHHHHHHHHHYSDDPKAGGKNSAWKHLQRMLHIHGRNKHEVHGDREMGKSMVARRNQVGHFYGLVEGLLRHIRHSKKSKQSKVTKKRKKFGWWRMFRRRRGMELPKKGRVKVGFFKRKKRR